jgi:hypothetical protein
MISRRMNVPQAAAVANGAAQREQQKPANQIEPPQHVPMELDTDKIICKTSHTHIILFCQPYITTFSDR